MSENGSVAYVSTLIAGLLALVIVLGVRNCDRKAEQASALRMKYIEHCQGTPAQAEKLWPSP